MRCVSFTTIATTGGRVVKSQSCRVSVEFRLGQENNQGNIKNNNNNNKTVLVTAVKYSYRRHKSVHISRVCGVSQVAPCAGDGSPTGAVLGEGA